MEADPYLERFDSRALGSFAGDYDAESDFEVADQDTSPSNTVIVAHGAVKLNNEPPTHGGATEV